MNYIKEFKELWTEEGRAIGFIEKELWKVIESMEINF